MDPIAIERNNESVLFAEGEKTRGKTKGEKYLKPQLDKIELSKLMAWMGADTAKGVLVNYVNRLAQGWYDEAVNENTGEFSEEEWKNSALGLSAKGETMGDLKERLEELLNEFLTCTDDDRVGELTRDIKSTKAAINSKKRERSPKEDAPQPVAA